MKISKIIIFFNSIIFSLGISATETYQCKNSEGKRTYSDKPCAAGELQVKHTVKNPQWIKLLDARKPVGTKIIDLKKENEETIIKYAYSTQTELSDFMKSAYQLSGLTVNLLKYKAPKDGASGEALIQITPTKDTLFKIDKS